LRERRSCTTTDKYTEPLLPMLRTVPHRISNVQLKIPFYPIYRPSIPSDWGECATSPPSPPLLLPSALAVQLVEAASAIETVNVSVSRWPRASEAESQNGSRFYLFEVLESVIENGSKSRFSSCYA